MALTVTRCADHIRLALGRDPSRRTSINEIVNAAGHWLFSACEWSWLERPAADLDFVAGRTYCVLPDDFGRVVSLYTGSLTSCVEMVSLGEIGKLRQFDPIASQFVTHAAILYAPGSTSSQPSVRLEIYPTPADNETAALKLFYRAAWTVLDADSESLQVPEFMEPLMLSAVKAYAMGWEKFGGRTLADYLEEVVMSREFQAAQSMDNSQQSEFGYTNQGAIGEQYGSRLSTRYTNTPWLVDTP